MGVGFGVYVGLCFFNMFFYMIFYFVILKVGGIVVNFNLFYVECEIVF